MVDLTCSCCGFKASFSTLDEAWASWELLDENDSSYVCDLCPAYYALSGMTSRHDPIHQQWRSQGRPPTFSQELCLSPVDRLREATSSPSKKTVSDILLATRHQVRNVLRSLQQWTDSPRSLASFWEDIG